MEYVIGCDVGSQSARAILLSLEGKVCGQAAREYAIDFPQPLWAEQPVERWTGALTAAVRQLTGEAGVRPAQVRGIGLASQVESVVPVDLAGRPLRPAILWMDRRAREQCAALQARLGAAAVLDRTGLNIDPSHVGPKIRWVMDRQPAIHAQTRSYLQTGSYVASFLCGETAVDFSNASATLLLDIRTRQWSGEMCSALGIDPALLPPLRPATEPLGRLRSAVAAEMGLSEDTIVVVGSGDEHAACLGAGVVRPGLVGDILGTAEPVCAAAPQPIFDPTGLLETHCHADSGLWLLENPGFVSGGNYRWFRDQFGRAEWEQAERDGGSSYALLDARAGRVPAGSEGLVFLPSTMGATTPTWDDRARGAFVGFTLAHTRDHFVRAILEGSAYAVRDLTERMVALGLSLDELRVMGGGSASPLWSQIKADVTGLVVTIPETNETTALGAAILALVGTGAYAALREACAQVVRVRERFEPAPENRALYDDMYALYRSVYFSLIPPFHRAAQQNRQPPR